MQAHTMESGDLSRLIHHRRSHHRQWPGRTLKMATVRLVLGHMQLQAASQRQPTEAR